MKKLTILICAIAFSFTFSADAQTKSKSVGKRISNTADTVALKTKTTTKKGVAKIVDKTYDGKQGPNGETVYIDNHSKYYYINAKGEKKYIAKAELKDK
ncbi:hypothetical protein F0919_08490 [Taibaiella lutea]|uniref:PBCV-specific basic adaptor domain-containing protein n=1 Tax=Taibaiella lutea TaxID=2608001 RepID=A0A5M6CHZ9_9BACT|nr:hypothetical protein [Taibaiella lutea]KAA5534643.1 hypothetical protein F0919_08490 [Taibaiella lutea]